MTQSTLPLDQRFPSRFLAIAGACALRVALHVLPYATSVALALEFSSRLRGAIAWRFPVDVLAFALMLVGVMLGAQVAASRRMHERDEDVAPTRAQLASAGFLALEALLMGAVLGVAVLAAFGAIDIALAFIDHGDGEPWRRFAARMVITGGALAVMVVHLAAATAFAPAVAGNRATLSEAIALLFDRAGASTLVLMVAIVAGTATVIGATTLISVALGPANYDAHLVALLIDTMGAKALGLTVVATTLAIGATALTERA